MKFSVLTSPDQWFVPYAQTLSSTADIPLYFRHEDIPEDTDVVFILSYHRLIAQEYLSRHRHNIVVHASDLPQGKGWAPVAWQILEGRNDIVFTLFEADAKADNGPWYLKKTVKFSGNELYDEIRDIQAQACVDMCLEFKQRCSELTPHDQTGEESFYRKRTAADSELDVNKSLSELFNQLRIADNENWPAFFIKDGRKYILRIERAD